MGTRWECCCSGAERRRLDISPHVCILGAHTQREGGRRRRANTRPESTPPIPARRSTPGGPRRPHTKENTTMTAQYPIDTTPEQPLDTNPKKKRRWVTPAIAFGTFTLGAIIGTSGASSDTTAEPAEVITETVTETETITETVEVEVVPQECRDALDAADDMLLASADLMDLMSDGFYLAGEAVVAAGSFDYITMEAINDELGILLGEVDAASAVFDTSTYPAARDACLAH